MGIVFDCVYSNGCSLTYGSDLENREEESYPSLIAQHLNLPLLNDALPGSSNERILRTSISGITDLLEKKLNPLVIIGWSESLRFELCSTDNEWIQFNSHRDRDAKLSNMIYSKYMGNNGQFETIITQMILFESFIKERKLKGLQFNMFPLPYFQMNFSDVDRAVKKFDKTYTLFPMFNIMCYLETFTNCRRTETDHPDKFSHRVIADFLIRQIEDRFI